MQSWISFGVTVFMGFFAIMNPVANASVFLGLTADLNRSQTKQIALRATMLAFFIVSAFSVSGQLLFELFGIGLPAFRTTGGILVFLVGKHLLEGRGTSPIHTPTSAMAGWQGRPTKVTGVAVSPLAIPILAGPGTIACGINFSSGRSLLH
ncbi:MAG: MarC family protein, partial [Polyangiaceae bacterium]|nr:MarC family protein [Polyangiaceae bacterium]